VAVKLRKTPHARQDICIRGKPYEENFNEMGLGSIDDADRVDT